MALISTRGLPRGRLFREVLARLGYGLVDYRFQLRGTASDSTAARTPFTVQNRKLPIFRRHIRRGTQTRLRNPHAPNSDSCDFLCWSIRVKLLADPVIEAVV